MSNDQNSEWSAEAEVLKLLSADTIEDFIAMFHIVANSTKVPRKERERARALIRLLGGLNRKSPTND